MRNPLRLHHRILMTRPSDGRLGGAPLRHLFRWTLSQPVFIAVMIGLGLQMLPFISGAFPAWAGQPGTLERPAYQILRFNEDWSVLRDVDRSKSGDFWDVFKFVPVTEDKNVWLSLGGQVRERLEYYTEYLFGTPGAPKQSDTYLLSRIRLSADLHVSPYFRIFAEGKSSLASSRDLLGGNSTSYVDTLDLQNGFLEAMIPFGDRMSVTLRGGRQELLFGAQRLVGPSDWGGNVRRTFDGGTATIRCRDWTITPFWAEFVPVAKDEFNNANPDRQLFGIYATGVLRPVNLDLYWLGVNNTPATFDGTTGREVRHTFGGRIWGKIGATGLDYEAEGNIQLGKLGDRDIVAGMFTGILGYTFAVPSLSPRVYIEFDYASGGKPDGDVNTYNQLYPTGHSFLGYIDYIGRQNIVSPSAGVSLSPIRGLSVSLQQYFFWRASDQDALYDKAGNVVRPGTTSKATYIGAETDLYATYNVTRHILVYAGYSHFYTGDFISETGASKDSDFLYAAIQYTF